MALGKEDWGTVRSNPRFADIGEDGLRDLVEERSLRRVARNQCVSEQGDRADAVLLILEVRSSSAASIAVAMKPCFGTGSRQRPKSSSKCWLQCRVTSKVLVSQIENMTAIDRDVESVVSAQRNIILSMAFS
jgi:hypothetical protein